MRRHRDKQQIKLKTSLSLVAARDKLYDQKYSAPLVPVDEPYQIGVIRRLVLREDCANRSDYKAYQYALKIGTRPVSLTFRDLKSNWIIDENKFPKYKTFRENEFLAFKLSEQVAALFYKFWWKDGYRYVLRYSIRYYFVIDSSPWMVTHYRSNLPEVESSIQRISNHMSNHRYWVSYSRLRGGSGKEKEDIRVWRRKFAMNKEDAKDFIVAKSANLHSLDFDVNYDPDSWRDPADRYSGNQEADYYYCQKLLNRKK